MKEDIIETLVRAREKLSRPDRWCQGVAAMGPMHSLSHDAWGAIYYSIIDIARDRGQLATGIQATRIMGQFDGLFQDLGEVKGSLGAWNDRKDQTQEKVVETFDRVIGKIQEVEDGNVD